MSSQLEPKTFTIPLSNAVHSNAVHSNAGPLIHRLSLVDKPLNDIPLLPGESIHLGYTPMTEEQAFAAKPMIPPQMTLTVSHFRMARYDVDIDELAILIHRFISINDAVERLVPKRQYIQGFTESVGRGKSAIDTKFRKYDIGVLHENNMEPGKQLYEAKVTHSWRNHHATIQVSVIAIPANRSEESDEYAISVNRLCGSVTAHRMFFHTLEQYVLSYGHSYPLIRPISVDREALATAPPPKQVTWQRNEHLPICKLQRQSRIDEPDNIYNREESDGEYPSSDEEIPYQACPFRDVIASKNIPDHYSSDEESK